MTAPAFALDGVSRTYRGAGPPVHALKPADLHLPLGSYCAIVGASGSGKSTLLNLLGLLDLPDTGTLSVCGTDSTALRPAERSTLRAREIGFVFQSFHLLAGRTVIENVELGLLYSGCPRRQRRTRAAAMLDRVGLAHRRDADVRTLSGGEKQRVAIARAVVTEARILLCDEPTGSLDSTNGVAVMTLLRELNAAGTTVVVVTHDAEVAAQASRSLTVSDGVLTDSWAAVPAADGTAAAVPAADGTADDPAAELTAPAGNAVPA
ncbi:ABC transporter ATP-binding protein [Actinoplanes sp. CA-015351]|uniref:ABC transporter ATP-binding protein n=1 Tax=Actinoplanes sp. CA-015351 TaxID=3239897 RepID=UPI003D95BC3F